MEFEKGSVDDLAERCRQEIEKFIKKRKSNPCPCYELFTKAFSEDSDKALNSLYELCRPLVISWIQHHPYYSKIRISQEEFFFDSMSHFVLALKGKSMEKFPTLSHILSYLRKCVHSVIMTDFRKYSDPELNPGDDGILSYEDCVDDTIIIKQAWNRIKEMLEDPKESLLAHLTFIQHLKPKQILKEFSGKWQDTNEIRVERQRIKRKLQNDDELKKILAE